MGEKRILVVEDDGIIAARMEDTLTSWGYATESVSSGEEAVERTAAFPSDLILMDVRLEGRMTGVEAATAIRRQWDVPVVYLTAYSDDALLESAKRTEPHGYLVKPVRDKELRATIEMALYKHEMDRKLRESEERYHAVVSQAIEAIYIFDIDTGRIIEINPGFTRLLGYTPADAAELTLYDLVADGRDGIDANIRAVIEAGRYALGERRYRRKDGELLAVEVNATLISYGGGQAISAVVHDITERKRMEAQRREMDAHIQYIQKMESLGVMAGAVAHHFNNLLSVILGHTEMVLSELPSGSPQQHSMKEIFKAGMRAREIIQQILIYRGQMPMKPGPVNLSILIREMTPMLEVSVSRSVRLEFDLADGLPTVILDTDQFRQLVVSILTNASESLGETGGTISLSTGKKTANREYLAEPYLDEDLEAGEYVTLTVTDTGHGMDSDTRSRIFDPFFTTKVMGRGLGLSAVLGIVRKHRGAIKVESEADEGTRVEVLFPVA